MAKINLSELNQAGAVFYSTGDADADYFDHTAGTAVLMVNNTASDIDVIIPVQQETIRADGNTIVLLADIAVTVPADGVEAVAIPPAYTGLRGRVDITYPNGDGSGLSVAPIYAP